MGTIISIANHKGGVGKTMTAHNLSAAMSLLGKKVLLVDLDPQVNLTVRCNAASQQNILLFFAGKAIIPTQLSENIDIIPGSEDLDNIALQMSTDPQRSSILLKKILAIFQNKYDYIIIDSAPGSSLLLVNALVACDEVIVPIADKDSILGARKLTKIFKANKISPKGHYLLTKFDSRTSVNKEIKSLLISKSASSLYHTYIRQTEALNRAACQSKDIFNYDIKSNGADDYMNLAKEICGSIADEDMPF